MSQASGMSGFERRRVGTDVRVGACRHIRGRQIRDSARSKSRMLAACIHLAVARSAWPAAALAKLPSWMIPSLKHARTTNQLMTDGFTPVSPQ